MAGKKKAGRARPGHSVQVQGCAAGSTSSMPSRAHPAASLKAQGGTLQQHGTNGSTAAGSTSCTAWPAANSLADALAEVHLLSEGGKDPLALSAGASTSRQRHRKQQQQQQQGGVAVGTAGHSSAAGCMGSTCASVSVPNMATLVDQLRSSNQESEQVHLLKHAISLAESSSQHRAAFLTAGGVPVALRFLQSNSEPLQAGVILVMQQLVEGVSSEEDITSIRGVIPQLVPLLRHRQMNIQHFTLQWLVDLSEVSGELGRCIAAAGAVPAVTEALHRGDADARLSAACLLQLLAKANGIGMEAAVAGAVPVALSVLECGDAEQQQNAACCLRQWAWDSAEASTLAVAQGAVPALVLLLLSEDTESQYEAARLLWTLVYKGGAAQAAIQEGTIPPLVQLLRSPQDAARYMSAAALQIILSGFSEAANMAAAEAGAIPPLLDMLARGTEDSHKAVLSSDCNINSRGPATELSLTGKEWQTAALASLCSIATVCGTQHRIAMVDAGAVAALSAAMHKQDQKVQKMAHTVFMRLLLDPGAQRAAAARLISMLLDDKVPLSQQQAADSVGQLCTEGHVEGAEEHVRAVILGEGVLTALVSLLHSAASPCLTLLAVTAMNAFTSEVPAVAETGAIRPLAHHLQSSHENIRYQTAIVFLNMAERPYMHGLLIEIIPQLVQAMLSADTDIHPVVGRSLQFLAGHSGPSMRQAFRAAAPHWIPLLSAKCSEAQQYAAASMYLMLLNNDEHARCTKTFKAMFNSIRVIRPDRPASQWESMK